MPKHRLTTAASAPPATTRPGSSGVRTDPSASVAQPPAGPAGADRRDTSPGWTERWLDPLLTVIVVALPFGLAVWRATGAAQWRADLAAVRDLGLSAVGVGGALSTVVTQALSLVPLGSQAFRAAVGAALALAVASYLLLRVAREVVRASQDVAPVPAPLRSVLCAVAACAAALSPTWQQEATLGGGASYAAAAVLACVHLVLQLTGARAATLTPQWATRWLLLAAAAGLAMGESLPAGLAACVVIVVAAVATGKRPTVSLVGPMLLAFVVVTAALLAPLMLRSLSPRNLGDVGRALSATSLGSLRVAASRTPAVVAWVAEVGYVSLALAGVGVVVGSLRKASRAALVPMVTLVAVDLVYPMAVASGLSPDRLIALRVLAIGALAVASALGIAVLVAFLLSLRVPMARSAAVLTVVFYLSVVAVTCEEAGFATDRSEQFASEAWTDDALGALPPRSALLLHSPDLAWRLWAARLSGGQRPDVLVVPAPLLHHPQVMASLLPAEPAITPLLRDHALTGQASEFALSALADARPVFVELHPEWGERLLGHLSADGHWLRYAPQPLGASDRKPIHQHVWADEGPLGRALAHGCARDDLTPHVVTRTLKQHAATLSLSGMSASARQLLDRVEQVDAGDPFVTGARLRLAYAEERRRRTVELRDLLRF